MAIGPELQEPQGMLSRNRGTHSQLLTHCSQTTIVKIDEVLDDLICPDPVSRMSAAEALKKLGNAIYARSPVSLLIHPKVMDSISFD